jgi:hypothetical protein
MNGYKNKAAEEYRIFKLLNSKNDEEYSRNELSPYLQVYREHNVENRIDFYIFPLSLEKKIAINYGIKFRDIKITKKGNFKAKKLELKFRFDCNNGVETWAKPVSTSVKKIKLLKKISPEDISKEGYYVIIDNMYYKIKIKKIVNCLKETFSVFLKDDQIINYLDLPFGFGITYKNRTQINGEDAIFKLSIFKIGKDYKEMNYSKNFYYRSYCKEGELTSSDKDYIRNKYSGNDLMIGYPEVILKLI